MVESLPSVLRKRKVSSNKNITEQFFFLGPELKILKPTLYQPQTGEVPILIYNMTTNEGNTSSFCKSTSCDFLESYTKLENVEYLNIFSFATDIGFSAQ